MGTQTRVHVVGTGTIGEPLISLLLRIQEALEIDEITFHKHSPRFEDRARIRQLMRQGAKLVVDPARRPEFEKMGLQPTYDLQDALAQSTVVVDCTAEGYGKAHKHEWYSDLSSARGFIAQGSETGFGKPYAYNINDAALIPDKDRFLQVVSCNTHNLAYE
jgi:glyceraldehyde-3-phosphate dehydrogenase/erythrose-4-phosphate dehydrogenase